MRARRETLPSGLTLVAEPHPGSEVVAIQGWVHAGAGAESVGELGCAHMLEHMLFRGTRRLDDGEVQRRVADAGGRVNAWTTFDDTVVELLVPRASAGAALGWMAELLRDARFDPALLEVEKDVVAHEIRGAEASPGSVARAALVGALFRGSRLAEGVRGTVEAVEALDVGALERFYRRASRPDNTTVVMVGGLDLDEAQEGAARAFGGWRRPTLALDLPTPPAPTPEPEVACLAGVGEGFSLAWSVPGASDADHLRCGLLRDALADRGASPLAGLLQAGALDLGVRYEASRRFGLLTITVATAPGRAAPLLGAALMLLDDLRERGPAAGLTRALRERAWVRACLEGEAHAGRARALGRAARASEASNVDPDAALERLAATSRSDLRAVARRCLRRRPAILVRGARPEPATLAEVVALTRPAPASTRARLAPQRDVTTRAVGDDLVVVVPRAAPLVEVRLVALAGRRLGPDALPGVGIVASRALAEATVRDPLLSLEGDESGAQMGGFDGPDVTGLWARAASGRAPLLLRLALERWLWSEPSAERLEAKRAEARRARLRAGELDRAVDALFARLFSDHPYGAPSSPVADLTTDAVRAHIARLRTAPRLVALVLGDVDVERVADATAHELTRARREPRPIPIRGIAPLAPGRIAVRASGERCPIAIGGRGPAAGTDDAPVLDVLVELLLGHAGLLHRELREERGLIYSLGGRSEAWLDAGAVSLYFEVARAHASLAIARTRAAIGRLAEGDVDEDSVRRAAAALEGAHRLRLQRRSVLANTMALHACTGAGFDAHTRYPSRLRAVTGARCAEAARRWLTSLVVVSDADQPTDQEAAP
ncbi:MAG: insulinase family protein [Sandaracinaceae bacterium]